MVKINILSHKENIKTICLLYSKPRWPQPPTFLTLEGNLSRIYTRIMRQCSFHTLAPSWNTSWKCQGEGCNGNFFVVHHVRRPQSKLPVFIDYIDEKIDAVCGQEKVSLVIYSKISDLTNFNRKLVKITNLQLYYND